MLFEIIFFALYFNYCIFFKCFEKKILSGIFLMFLILGLQKYFVIKFILFDFNLCYFLILVLFLYFYSDKNNTLKMTFVSVLLSFIYLILSLNNIFATTTFNYCAYFVLAILLCFLFKNEYLIQTSFILLFIEIVNCFIFVDAVGFYNLFSNDFMKILTIVFIVNLVQPNSLFKSFGRRSAFYAIR